MGGDLKGVMGSNVQYGGRKEYGALVQGARRTRYEAWGEWGMIQAYKAWLQGTDKYEAMRH
jgi:hypothetical protein